MRSTATALAAALACAASDAGAWEYLKLRSSASLRMDSNVFRVPDNVDSPAPDGTRGRSDMIRSLAAGASLEIPVSRQLLQLSYDVSRARYAKFSDLDFDGEDARAQLRWEAGRFASGNAGVTRSTNLTDFSETLGRRANLRTTTRRFVDAALPFHANWRIGAGASRTEQANDDPLSQINDSVTDAVNGELRYSGGDPRNYVSAQANRLQARFPNPVFLLGVPIDSSYDQDSYGLGAGYATGAVSSLRFSIFETRRTPKGSARDESKGLTGTLGADWAPTAKTAFALTGSRDFAPADTANTSRSVITLLQLSATWAATEKILVRGDVTRTNQDYSLTPGPVAALLTANRRDTMDAAGIAVSYAPHRLLTIVLSARREERDSNLPSAVYSANILSATAQLAF